MRAMRIVPGPQGGHLEFQEVPTPAPGPGQVVVRVMDSPRDLGQQPDRGRWIAGELRGSLRQADAVDQLHAEVMLSVVRADLVDRHDVGMIEIGGRLRFLPKALHVAIGGKLPGQIAQPRRFGRRPRRRGSLTTGQCGRSPLWSL